MNLDSLTFTTISWLWGLAILPITWLSLFFFYKSRHFHHSLNKYIDAHLLAHLVVDKAKKNSHLWKKVFVWSFVWSCLIISLAGPKWSYREMEVFSKDQSLVIIFDLSESMNATDVKPSRLIKAKQKIEDFLKFFTGVKIGLIAFAADSHMITPITEDKATIQYLLQSLDTSLVFVQGSRLTPALNMAKKMLDAEAGTNKAILLVSDGGFEDGSAIITAKKLADTGITIHAMGVGTLLGAPLKNHEGNIVKKNGQPIVSKLEKDKLVHLSQISHGLYLEAEYSDRNETALLKEFNKNNEVIALKKLRLWDESFYLFILPTIPFILWWFRRGYIFACLFFFIGFPFEAKASFIDYFKNNEELGKQAYDTHQYEIAADYFQNNYHKGVAYYKAGNYAEAEEWFKQDSLTSDEADKTENHKIMATYNLGNAYVQQKKFKEALSAYEAVLENQPQHVKAKENLELVKKMMDQDKSQDNQDKSKDNQKSQDNQDKSDKDQDDKSEKDQDNKSKDTQDKEPKDQIPSESKSKNQDKDLNPQDDEDMDNRSQEEKAPHDTPNSPKNDETKHPNEEKETPHAEELNQMSQEENSLRDKNADLLLNRLKNDPKMFLKNKFSHESKTNGTKEGIDPW